MGFNFSIVFDTGKHAWPQPHLVGQGVLVTVVDKRTAIRQVRYTSNYAGPAVKHFASFVIRQLPGALQSTVETLTAEDGFLLLLVRELGIVSVFNITQL